MTPKSICKGCLLLLILVFTIIITGKAEADISSAERAALIALYNSTNGDNWIDKSGWKTSPLYLDGFALSGTEKNWYGVTCNPENTTVLEIDLYDNNLAGTIPSALVNLANLQKIYIGSNHLTGTIPAELGNLSNLQWLILECNELTGPIPIELGNLTSLQVMGLVGNYLTGSIPVQLSNLNNLIALSLGSNRLTGTIPVELGNLTNLIGLYLHSNQFTGTIPSELGALDKLQYLYLDDNQLTGTIQEELANLVNMEYLRLQGNQLTGVIPASLANLNLLTYINLGYNALNTENEDLLLFINEKSPGWQNTQTIPPDNVTVKEASTNSIRLGWSSINYIAGSGGYVVSYSPTSGGPYTVSGITDNKTINQMEITGLNPGKSYYFVVQAKTGVHENNKNTVISDYSIEVSALTEPDSDGDMLSDNLESTTCTDENDADTDDDVILDGIEDKNKNGIVDEVETDPCNSDTDKDGILDGVEDANQNGIVDTGETDPTKFDTDNDGIPDGWEVRYGLNPLVNDAEVDADGDGFSNKKEYQRGTDPTDYNSQPSKALPWLLLLLGDD